MSGSGEPLLRRWVRRAGVAASMLLGPLQRHRALARIRGFARGHALARRCREHAPDGKDGLVIAALVEHLGDIVAAEPISRRLRRDHPHARIGWVVKTSFRELVDTNPHIDFAIPVNCLSEWIHMARLPEIAAHSVDLHVPGRACAKCHVRLENSTAPPGLDIANYYFHGALLHIFCKCGGLPAIDEGPRVYIPPGAVTRVNGLELPVRFVAVHCKANQRERDWSAAKWRELTRRFSETGVAVAELGLEPIIGDGSIDLCGRLGILETAEVIRRAALFIGIDSGPAHLANAVETPGLILLGRYRAYTCYVPYSGAYASGQNATLLTADGPASELPVDRVFDAACERMSRERSGAAESLL